MAEVTTKRRWIIALLIVTAVVTISAVIILLYHETPSELGMHAVSDGNGGIIIAWQDGQSFYVQRLTPDGKPLWSNGGIKISGQGSVYALKADGTGGAIVSWARQRTTDYNDPAFFDPITVYSQRISASGEQLWENAVATGTSGSGSFPEIVPDGSGGTIFGWNDYKTYFKGLHDDFLRVQKVGPDGRLLWGSEGVLVTASSPYHPLTDEEKAHGIQGTFSRSWPTYTGYQRMVSDGAQGAIVIWHEEDYENRMFRVYAQRVDGEGNFVWPKPILMSTTMEFPNFTSVPCGADGGNEVVALAIPGAGGGGLMTFMCFDRDGRLVWQKSMASGMNYSTEVISDGRGGILISRYEDIPPIGPPSERSISLYLQRLDREGDALWTERPVITTQEGQSLGVDMVSDGSGGAILAWRLGEMEHNAYVKLFAQGLDAEGNTIWGEGGLTIFPDSKLKYQGMPKIISTDSGAIVIAVMGRSALQGDMIYAQKLDASGNRLWGDGIRIVQ